MANNLPPGVLPKLYRQRNAEGKEVGAWYIKVKKKPVNLRTQIYSKARDRARDAFFNQVREFVDDRFYETPAPESPITSPDVEGQGSSGPLSDLAADVASAASSGLKPDAYFDATGKETPLPSAVPEGSERPPTDAPKVEPESPKPNAPDGDTTHIPPEMFAGMMSTCANLLVEGQLRGQEWMLARGLKMKAATVGPDDMARMIAVKFWQQQLAEWVPQDIPLPKWASAMIAVSTLGLMAQLNGATPIVKEETSSPPQSAYATG